MNVNELLSLKGKVILVTGGSGKYGQCIVEGLAEAGATVITTSRDIRRAEETAAHFCDAGYEVIAMAVDQSRPATVDALKKQISERFEKLDGFVNNAVSRPMKDDKSPLGQFAESMEDNATGMFHLLREMTDLIIQSGGRGRFS